MNNLNYRYSFSKPTSLIYLTFLIGIILILVLLPYLKTTISIKSQGLLQSSTEKADLNIPVNGIIKKINLKDNASIVANDTLLVIDANLPDQENSNITERVNLLRQNLADTHQLLKQTNATINLTTNQYVASWQQYHQEASNAYLAKQQAQKIYLRYEKLFKGNVLTVTEYEKYKFDYEQATNACLLLDKKYRNQWQTEANQYKEELRQLNSKITQLAEQKRLYVLTAPITGSVQNITGLQRGTYVFANQKIGEISPNTQLTAFCYIKPADIGLIRKGQAVRFNIDAFNYNQWGFVTGIVLDISDDILMADKQPVFKVKCSLNQEFLQLKNGYKGNLKKGMTFNARFMVTERSLYQLLYDKMDDWVNPNLASN